MKWEFDRYEPYAFAVYTGATPHMKAVYSPLRMPEKAMGEGEIERTAILTGGDPFSPADPVKPDALSAIGAFNPDLRAEIPDRPGRPAARARQVDLGPRATR